MKTPVGFQLFGIFLCDETCHVLFGLLAWFLFSACLVFVLGVLGLRGRRGCSPSKLGLGGG
ncbi:MAG: hypothetical protein K0U36_01935 [Alphaproteobacteria bacterium]|nr:hypothetical protein [Alphaproteobacteria bacterium]